ncbi:MAG: hypothetical protein A2Y17_00355 [Clostridiales bacterium GWF2_38_85]|nr:MAG: hypothetical protein A2Y17_00355 [Clostridiales bacterium GWF2_38_85]HBL83912.1 mucin desulfatase [Clostridiales bacterium]
MRDKLIAVCRKFRVDGDCVDWRAISNGLINDSYWMEFRKDERDKQYVLQRINLHVFKSPDKVMENIERVTDYIKSKCKNSGNSSKRSYMTFYHTKDNKNYYIDDNNDFWRISKYIQNSIIIDDTDDLDIIREIGFAFGQFQEKLSDFPAEMLYETIKDFHTTTKRYQAFKKSIEESNIERLIIAKNEIDYLLSVEEQACKLTIMAENRLLPYRVTHNDTKCNNVLLDEDTRKALCVIDLDTVMPGLVMHDFGDAARYICNNACEDSRDLNKVHIDISKFRAFTEGFLLPIKHTLTELEIEYMAYGVFVMATELATRFLTDYLNGDKYFKINYTDHNLARARCQIALAKDIYSNMNLMNKIVYEYVNQLVMAI